jgi:hypothetical protein
MSGQWDSVTRRRFLNVVAAFAAVQGVASCGGGGGGGGGPAAATPVPSGTPPPSPPPPNAPPAAGAFPLAIAAGRRYLTDRNGRPFPLLARALWAIPSLPRAEFQAVIADTAARGFTAIEFCLHHFPGKGHSPFDGQGNAPFAKRLDGSAWDGSLFYGNANNEAPDFTQPNAPYWSNIDAIIESAASRNLMVLWFPVYAGFILGNDGWRLEMAANGTARMRSYGAWIANRYKDTPNIVWMLGGDHMFDGEPEFSAAEQALIDGMLSVAGQASMLISNEWLSGSIGTDQPDFGRYINLNGCYSWDGRTASICRKGYAHTPTIPAFLQEGPYDQEGADGNSFNPNATQPVRRFSWWAWLSAIGGYTFGNGYVWPMNPDYTEHLDTVQTRHHAVLNNFIGSIDWWTLVPDGLGDIGMLVTAGGGTIDTDDYVAAAANPAGTLLVAYVGPGHSGDVTIDMSRMRGSTTGRWFDPTSGGYQDIGTLPNSGTRSFAPPGVNAAGDRDWVLILTG